MCSQARRRSDGFRVGRRRTAPETHASVIELVTGIQSDVPGVVAELAELRVQLARELRAMGLTAASAGTYPLAGSGETRVSGYGGYVGAVDALIGSGALPDPSFLWWDVRLQPELGTVEVRVMDAQSTVADSAALIALVQSLAWLELEGDSPETVVGAEVLAEDRFLAARDGLHARLIDPVQHQLVPVRALLDAVLARCRAPARALGCSGELDEAAGLTAAGGADRQRAVARESGLVELVRTLSDLFAVRRGRAREGTPLGDRR